MKIILLSLLIVLSVGAYCGYKFIPKGSIEKSIENAPDKIERCKNFMIVTLKGVKIDAKTKVDTLIKK